MNRETEIAGRIFEVYMSGLMSGFATALLTMGVPEDDADRTAQTWCDRLASQQTMVEAVLREIDEILSGRGGPGEGRTVPVPPEAS